MKKLKISKAMSVEEAGEVVNQLESKELDFVLGHAVTQYDRMQSKRKYYNPNALGIYLQAVKEIIGEVGRSKDNVSVIRKHFLEPMVTSVIKNAGKLGETILGQRKSSLKKADIYNWKNQPEKDGYFTEGYDLKSISFAQRMLSYIERSSVLKGAGITAEIEKKTKDIFVVFVFYPEDVDKKLVTSVRRIHADTKRDEAVKYRF